MKTPGIKNQRFILKLANNPYSKGDIITSGSLSLLRIIKVHDHVWWRRILQFFKLKTKLFTAIVEREETVKIEDTPEYFELLARWNTYRNSIKAYNKK